MQRGFTHQLNGSALVPGKVQLRVESLHLQFGELVVLSDVSLDVHQGEILAVIGPNGAGKTSLLNCISGLYRPQKGQIRLRVGGESGGESGGEREITKLPPHRIARLGVARSFQNIELFRHMTVLDNLLSGCHVHMRSGLIASMLYWGRAEREQIQFRRFVEDIIDFLEIAAIRKKTVDSLPYGLQKRVELGRALAMKPALLLLDEPMAGMNSEEKEDMARFVLDINDDHGITIVLLEHDMGVVMDISDRIAVLDSGTKIAEGPPAEVRENEAVIQAYLGAAQPGGM